MTVYADVLVVVNYIVNLLLLTISAKLLGVITARRRICGGALAGALGSLVIFLPWHGFWFQLSYQILLSLAMTAITFGAKQRLRFLRALFMTFTVSFLFAGLMLALTTLLAPTGILFYNGVVYFDISALTLILSTGAAYLLLSIFEKLFFCRTAEKQLYNVTVRVNGKAIALKGLADTGSSLKEPFSGAPVIVCDKELAGRIRPEQNERFRVIPCLTVTGVGALEGFRPDEVLISGGGKQFATTDVYIASSRETICGEYQALINPQLVERG